MVLIHEINEQNYLEEIEKGEKVVNAKFDEWDRLLGLNIDIKEFKAKTAYAWRDPTIWSYAILKDKQNRPLKLRYYQDMVINDRHRFVHVTAANQIGKTWGPGIIKGLHHALHTNNGSVMLISRSELQAKGILDEMKWMINRAKLDFTPFEDEVSNRFEYHVKSPDGVGTSVVRVFPPTKKILGFPSTLTIKDETGFWELKEDLTDIELYQQVIEPRSNETKKWKHPFLTMGQNVSITNPNGQHGLAYYLRNSVKYHNYIWNWLACPGNTWEEYEEHRRDLPAIRFASIYAAKYLAASGGFITPDQYQRFSSYNSPLVISPGVIFLGADFASEEPKSRGTDHAAIYGVNLVKNVAYPQNPRVRVCYYRDFAPGTPRETIYNEILRIKNLTGVSIGKFGYDKVGVADSVKRDLIGRGILGVRQIEALTYSLPNKSDVFLNFQALFEQDMIEGTHIPMFEKQVLALKVEQPVGSIHIKVHHKTEGIKDDHPDALANACFVAKAFYSYATSKFIIRGSASHKPSNNFAERKHDESIKRGIAANNKFFDYLKGNSANQYF